MRSRKDGPCRAHASTGRTGTGPSSSSSPFNWMKGEESFIASSLFRRGKKKNKTNNTSAEVNHASESTELGEEGGGVASTVPLTVPVALRRAAHRTMLDVLPYLNRSSNQEQTSGESRGGPLSFLGTNSPTSRVEPIPAASGAGLSGTTPSARGSWEAPPMAFSSAIEPAPGTQWKGAASTLIQRGKHLPTPSPEGLRSRKGPPPLASLATAVPPPDPLARSLVHLLPGRKFHTESSAANQSIHTTGEEEDSVLSAEEHDNEEKEWEISDFEDSSSSSTSPISPHRPSGRSLEGKRKGRREVPEFRDGPYRTTSLSSSSSSCHRCGPSGRTSDAKGTGNEQGGAEQGRSAVQTGAGTTEPLLKVPPLLSRSSSNAKDIGRGTTRRLDALVKSVPVGAIPPPRGAVEDDAKSLSRPWWSLGEDGNGEANTSSRMSSSVVRGEDKDIWEDSGTDKRSFDILHPPESVASSLPFSEWHSLKVSQDIEGERQGSRMEGKEGGTEVDVAAMSRILEIPLTWVTRLPLPQQEKLMEEVRRRHRPLSTFGKPFHAFPLQSTTLTSTSRRRDPLRRSSSHQMRSPLQPGGKRTLHDAVRSCENQLDAYRVLLQSASASSSTRRSRHATHTRPFPLLTGVEKHLLKSYLHWRVHIERWLPLSKRIPSLLSSSCFSLDGTGLRVAFQVLAVEEQYHLIRLSGRVVGVAKGDMLPACVEALESMQNKAMKREHTEQEEAEAGEGRVAAATQDRISSSSLLYPTEVRQGEEGTECGDLLTLLLPLSLSRWLSSSSASSSPFFFSPPSIVYLGEPFYLFPSLLTLVSSYNVTTHRVLEESAREYLRREGTHSALSSSRMDSTDDRRRTHVPPLLSVAVPPLRGVDSENGPCQKEEERGYHTPNTEKEASRAAPSSSQEEDGKRVHEAHRPSEEEFLGSGLPAFRPDPQRFSLPLPGFRTGISLRDDTPTPFRPCFFDPLQQSGALPTTNTTALPWGALAQDSVSPSLRRTIHVFSHPLSSSRGVGNVSQWSVESGRGLSDTDRRFEEYGRGSGYETITGVLSPNRRERSAEQRRDPPIPGALSSHSLEEEDAPGIGFPRGPSFAWEVPLDILESSL